jgi:uncharacterized protein YkwD
MDQVSQAWACKMAAADALSHNPNYESQVMVACGCGTVAENVAYDYSADGAWNAWLASSTHNANIHGAGGGVYGVGAAKSASGKIYFVQNFGH